MPRDRGKRTNVGYFLEDSPMTLFAVRTIEDKIPVGYVWGDDRPILMDLVRSKTADACEFAQIDAGPIYPINNELKQQVAIYWLHDSDFAPFDPRQKMTDLELQKIIVRLASAIICCTVACVTLAAASPCPTRGRTAGCARAP
jgi:hypothetical protein